MSFDEPAYNPNPPEDNDFTAEDDEPIPYTVTDYITEHHKIALEIAELRIVNERLWYREYKEVRQLWCGWSESAIGGTVD